MDMSQETKKWIEGRYRAWRDDPERPLRDDDGKRQDSVGLFAEYVGVSRGTMTNWLNRGKTPTVASAGKLAKLGPEIYDFIGVPRPQTADPGLRLIIENWGNIPNAVQKEVIEYFQSILARSGGVERVGDGLEEDERA